MVKAESVKPKSTAAGVVNAGSRKEDTGARSLGSVWAGRGTQGTATSRDKLSCLMNVKTCETMKDMELSGM